MRRRAGLVLCCLLILAAASPATPARGAVLAALASPDPALVGQAVIFSALTPGNPGTTCTWEIGSRTRLTGNPVSYAFSRPGTYLVSLRVLSPEGQTSREALVVHVRPSGPASTPATGTISLSPSAVTHPGRTVNFSTEVQTVSGSPYGFIWLFGDGESQSGPEAAHAYGQPGSYTVSLYTFDGRGGQAVQSLALEVRGEQGSAQLVADAGPDKSATRLSSVVLEGCGSTWHSGRSLSYSWRQVSGTPVTLRDRTSHRLQFTAPSRAGQLVFELTVQAGGLTSRPDRVTVTVR